MTLAVPKEESSSRTRRGKDKGVDSQVSIMKGRQDGERSLEVSFAENEESVAELKFFPQVVNCESQLLAIIMERPG